MKRPAELDDVDRCAIADDYSATPQHADPSPRFDQQGRRRDETEHAATAAAVCFLLVCIGAALALVFG